MQSMDSSHVCLVSFDLRDSGFSHFRCDMPLTLGINLENLAKILKCAGAWRRSVSVSVGAERDANDANVGPMTCMLCPPPHTARTRTLESRDVYQSLGACTPGDCGAAAGGARCKRCKRGAHDMHAVPPASCTHTHAPLTVEMSTRA
jgi:hypothetical protein